MADNDPNNQPQGGDTPPKSDPPQETGGTDAALKAQQTKAYSDLHNQHKDLQAKHDDLEKKYNDLSAQIQKEKDKGKDVDQLMQDLNEVRAQKDASSGKLTEYDTKMKDLIDKSMEGLSDEQKALLDNASEDPFKRLAFINTLKSTSAPPKKTSQGETPGGDDEITIDVDDIVERAARGDMAAYREVKKKYGPKKAKEFIAKATAEPVRQPTSS